jgi:DNA-binding transcriptional ArsR family regulator
VATYAAALKALANPIRRSIFERVCQCPCAVGDLAEGLPVSRPAVSQHLKVLKGAGLVADRADGARRVYQLDPAGLVELRGYLDRWWGTSLSAFATFIDQGGADDA